MMGKQFRKVKAIFSPSKEHELTLREEYKQFIGKEFVFQYCHQMDEDDMFPGVWALIPLPNEEDFIASWVPEFDLISIETV
jgi:hypothetical protein